MTRERLAATLHGAGTVVLGAGLCVSLPLCQVGLAVALAGLALGGRWRDLAFPGWPWFALAAAWQYLAGAVGAADYHLHTEQFAWLALPAVAAPPPAWRRGALWALLAGLAIAALLAGIQAVVGYNAELRPFRIDPSVTHRIYRPSGFFSQHLHFSFVLACVLLALAAAPRRHGLPAPAWWAGRTAAAAGLILAQARSALLGAFCGFATAVAVRGGRRALLAAATLLLAAAAGIGALTALNPDLVRSIGRHQDARLTIWGIGAGIARDHPVLGVGGKAEFATAYRARLAEDRPEAFVVFDPDDPDEAFAHFSEVREHPWFAERLRVYRGIRPADEHLRPRFRRELIASFAQLSGNAGLFPQGAPHAHSSLLTQAAFYGVPCAAASLLALATLAVGFWRRRRTARAAAALGCGLVVHAFVAGLFEHFAGDGESVYALFVTGGLCWALVREGEDEGDRAEKIADDRDRGTSASSGTGKA